MLLVPHLCYREIGCKRLQHVLRAYVGMKMSNLQTLMCMRRGVILNSMQGGMFEHFMVDSVSVYIRYNGILNCIIHTIQSLLKHTVLILCTVIICVK